MKDGCISKLTITETGHQATQYEMIMYTLPILCVDKNYRCINDVLFVLTNLAKADFTLSYPNLEQWRNTYKIEIKTVN